MLFSHGLKNGVTVVNNEFIDQYMVSANGEHVKVYLYILCHKDEDITISSIADALNHTEADVTRAIAYWEKVGVIKKPEESPVKEKAPNIQMSEPKPQKPKVKEKVVYTQDQVMKLQSDEDFSQLLYIAQQYLNKVFTQRECAVYAYLYDGLQMSIELLEFLTEYCVQNNHTSIRYIETVALNWHENQIDTVERAKAYTMGFGKDVFGVLKAFGINDRSPAESEKEIINKWYKELGFTKEIIIEACRRTIDTIHTPSFQYADKILTQWKKQGVKHLSDISNLDQKRQSKGKSEKGKPANNRFHNFEQRDTNYESLVMDQVQSWMAE